MRIYKEVKKDLFSFKSEKLSGMSILLIAVLDIFLASLIFEGIDKEQSKLQKTYSAYPYQCMSMFKASDFSFDKYSLVFGYRGSTQYSESYTQSEKCQKLSDKIKVAKHTPEIKRAHNRFEKIDSELKETSRRISAMKTKYPKNYDMMPEYDRLLNQEKSLKTAKDNLPKLSSFIEVQDLIAYKNTNKDLILKEKDSHERWFIIKEYLYMLKFVIPLLLIVLYFYTKNKKAQIKGKKYNNIVLMITSHLTFILMVPFVFSTLHIIYSFIPKKLIANIVELLISIGALFLGYYMLILISILFIFALVYYIQKREKNKSVNIKGILANIRRGLCHNCKSKVNYEKDSYCSYCQAQLRKECDNCKEEILNHLRFCKHCGSEQSENNENKNK
ncbi:MAG: hypothetical protein GY793_04900 [Proteobacteria bacterium]|nr:hypothetical protein [Pseudomonadota bacterium]